MQISLIVLHSPGHTKDFGVGDWGMTQEQIKLNETRPNLTPLNATDYLIFEVTLPNIEKARLIYQFKKNQLIEGRFLFFTDTPNDLNQSIKQYYTVIELLQKQFGKPLQNKIITLSPVSLDNTQLLQSLLRQNQLFFFSDWNTTRSLLKHQLAWKEDKPHHQIKYQPIKMP